MFDWIGKSVMEMTRSDEIAKSICIITVLAVIGLIGWAVDKLENRRENMNRSKNIKIDFRIIVGTFDLERAATLEVHVVLICLKRTDLFELIRVLGGLGHFGIVSLRSSPHSRW